MRCVALRCMAMGCDHNNTQPNTHAYSRSVPAQVSPFHVWYSDACVMQQAAKMCDGMCVKTHGLAFGDRAAKLQSKTPSGSRSFKAVCEAKRSSGRKASWAGWLGARREHRQLCCGAQNQTHSSMAGRFFFYCVCLSNMRTYVSCVLSGVVYSIQNVKIICRLDRWTWMYVYGECTAFAWNYLWKLLQNDTIMWSNKGFDSLAG